MLKVNSEKFEKFILEQYAIGKQFNECYKNYIIKLKYCEGIRKGKFDLFSVKRETRIKYDLYNAAILSAVENNCFERYIETLEILLQDIENAADTEKNSLEEKFNNIIVYYDFWKEAATSYSYENIAKKAFKLNAVPDLAYDKNSGGFILKNLIRPPKILKLNVKVRLKSSKSKEQKEVACKQLLVRLLLNDKIYLSEINQNIRINNPSLYVTAFRLAREKSSIDCYINALNILHSDINACKSNNQKAYLEKLFNNYLELNTFQNINIALPKYTSPYKETIKNLATSKSSQIIFVDSKNDCNYR